MQFRVQYTTTVKEGAATFVVYCEVARILDLYSGFWPGGFCGALSVPGQMEFAIFRRFARSRSCRTFFSVIGHKFSVTALGNALA